MMVAPQASDQTVLELIHVLEQLWQALMTLAGALLMIVIALFTIASALLSLTVGGLRLVALGSFVVRVAVAKGQAWCVKQSSTPLPFC